MTLRDKQRFREQGRLTDTGHHELDRLWARQRRLRDQADALTVRIDRIRYCPHGLDLSIPDAACQACAQAEEAEA